MVAPVRYTAGFTQDAIYQPFGQIGVPNPFFYHLVSDDFDELDAAKYTTTALSSGTATSPSFDGGAVLLTTAATGSDTVAIQKKTATFLPIPATSSVAGKKIVFLTRIRLSDVVACGFNIGLLNTTTTAFAPTDGFYFLKVAGSAVVSLVSRVAGVSTTVAVPATSFTLTNNVDTDLAIYYDGKGAGIGTLYGTIGPSQVGYAPQSGTGATPPVRAPSVGFQPATVPAVLLNPTISLMTSTAVANTLTADLMAAGRER